MVGVSDREKVGYYRPKQRPTTNHEEIERGERTRPETHYTDEERGSIFRNMLKEAGLVAPGWSRKTSKRCRSKKTCCALTCDDLDSKDRTSRCGPCKKRSREDGGDKGNHGCKWRPPCKDLCKEAYKVYKHLTDKKGLTNDEAVDGICNGTNGFVKADHKKSNETRIKKSALMRVEELGEEMDEDEEGWRFEGLEEDVGKQVRRRVKYLKKQKGKDDIKELGIPEAHLEGIKAMMTQKESSEENVRGRTMERRQVREREDGPKGERLQKKAENQQVSK